MLKVQAVMTPISLPIPKNHRLFWGWIWAGGRVAMSHELRGHRSTQSHGPWQLSYSFIGPLCTNSTTPRHRTRQAIGQDLVSSRTQRAFPSTRGCSGGCCHAASPAAVQHLQGTHGAAAAVRAAQ